MKTQYFSVTDPRDPALKTVGAILRNGGLAAIPTETVYGLAASALDDDAVRGIFNAKGRPADNPLIVHISDLSQWDALVTEIPDNAKRLAAAYWPGPLTIILPKSERVSSVVSGGLSTVAVRMPSHPIARAVIDAAGVPLAAPSANTSGKPSPTAAQHVKDDLDGKIDCIVDAGPCPIGVESTVVSLAGEKPRLLRPGGVTPEMLEAVLGEIDIDDAVFHRLADDETAASPGMKYKHYAPAARVTILKGSFAQFRQYVDAHKAPGTMALCFAGEENALPVPAIAFGKADDGSTQAARIFAALRELDKRGATTVFARYPQIDGVGLAVFNRLVRAAAFQIIDLGGAPCSVTD